MDINNATLSRCLKSEIEALRKFVALLHEEQSALVSGKLERLAAYAEPKAHSLLELTKLSADRLEMLRLRGLPQNKAGMERLLQMPEMATENVLAEWHNLLELTQTAHQANEINGTLIGVRLRGTQQALSALFSAAKIPDIYRADGSTVGLHAPCSRAVA